MDPTKLKTIGRVWRGSDKKRAASIIEHEQLVRVRRRSRVLRVGDGEVRLGLGNFRRAPRFRVPLPRLRLPFGFGNRGVLHDLGRFHPADRSQVASVVADVLDTRAASRPV